ncbi:hypothetical protein [Aquipseudomonas alcaligenes]|uniref:Uncharacterized protein n=1 Tax=Aquipseudomonas alcaligenes TaxID=43263 RepID=A0A5C7W2A6_AQUAC|nr:hypothetical protein [Pseudomonas alcaligenes]TXI32091.1 MAG: hypothetical protein E6Q69_09780 [Pseudomonas alcaligenes]
MKLAISLAFSFLSAAMLLIFYYLGLEFYKALGYSPARGISLGIGIEILLISYFFINTFTIFCSRLYLRAIGIGAVIIITFYLLWPYYPLRTAYLCFSGSLITVLACSFSDIAVRFLSNMDRKKND